MSLPLCTVSGIIYGFNGDLCPNVPVYIHQVLKSGTIISSDVKEVISDENGVVEFIAPRESIISIRGNFNIGSTDCSTGSPNFQIPDVETITLEQLEIWESVNFINIPVGPKGDTGDQGLPGIQGPPGEDGSVIDATSSLHGLMSAADKTIVDELSNNYAPLAHSHTATDISDFDAAVLAVSPPAPVTSVFGRVGAVVAAQDDYSFAQLASKPTTLAGYGILDAAPLVHTHASSQITDFAAAADARIAAWVGAAPAAFDTLVEIATQMAADESGVAALTTTVGGKASKSANLSDLTNIATARTNLGLATVASSGLASDLTGILPNASFPATLPVASGVNLTALNAANISSGILATARGGTGIAFFTAAGPTAARVYTFPDAAATIARTDAAQTFAGLQTFFTPVALSSDSGTAGVRLKPIPSASRVDVRSFNDAAGGQIYSLRFGVDNAGTDVAYLSISGVQFISSVGVTWSSTINNPASSVDTQITRNAAGVLQIGTTAANALGSLKCAAITQTGQHTISTDALAGAPPLLVSGNWLTSTAGAVAQVLIQQSGATAFAGVTSGTGLAVNAAGTFSGDLINFQVNGSARLRLDVNGMLTSPVFILGGGGTTLTFPTFGSMMMPVSGQVYFTNIAQTGQRALVLGPTTPSMIGAIPTHSQSFAILQAEELLTIAAAATSVTTMQVPAGAIVLSVSTRTQVAIPTAASYSAKIGAQQFNTAAVSTALNSTDAGTAGGAFYLAASTAVTITPDVQPATNVGRVRVSVTYLLVTPATS